MLSVNQLLQEIQDAVGCHYLSDLNQMNFATLGEKAKEQILKIPDDKYTTEEWEEALVYMTGRRNHVATVHKAKEMIQKMRGIHEG